MFDHYREGPDHLLFLCLVALAAARRRARPGPTARRLGLLTITFTLDVALAAARAGTAVVDDMYGSALAVEHKTATDFATAADRAAEQAILDVIRASRPDDGFEGEELGAVRVGTLGRTWLVDPLCGTVNFAVEAPAFCVKVALVVDGTTTTAVVIHPPTGETYWAYDSVFGVLGRDRSPAPNRLVDINADGPLDRDFVGAQLAADPAFRAVFNPRVESSTAALAWVASGRRLGASSPTSTGRLCTLVSGWSLLAMPTPTRHCCGWSAGTARVELISIQLPGVHRISRRPTARRACAPRRAPERRSG